MGGAGDSVHLEQGDCGRIGHPHPQPQPHLLVAPSFLLLWDLKNILPMTVFSPCGPHDQAGLHPPWREAAAPWVNAAPGRQILTRAGPGAQRPPAPAGIPAVAMATAVYMYMFLSLITGTSERVSSPCTRRAAASPPHTCSRSPLSPLPCSHGKLPVSRHAGTSSSDVPVPNPG